LLKKAILNMNTAEILRLPAQVIITEALEDSQVIRPHNAVTEEEFNEFLRSKRCSICLGVPRIPAAIAVSGCGHEGCLQCLARFKCCPVGRCATYSSKDLLRFECWPHRAKASFKQDLLVKCVLCSLFECGTLDQLIMHETTECSERIVCCPKYHCLTKGTPVEMVAHYPKCTADNEAFDAVVTMSHVSKWAKLDNNRRSQEDSLTPQAVPNYSRRSRSRLALFML